MLRWVTYPDALGTGSDFVTYNYNRQGQQTLVIDQRGCQHAYDYDGLGRQIHDRVPTLGTSAVGNSRRISTVYDTRGMVSTVTTWNDPRVGFGTVLNQVQNEYNDFGQQTHSYQEHVGSVNISTTPKVQYSYASGAANSNTIRMTGMTYPNGRGTTYDYGTAGGMNDACSRIESVINAVIDSVNVATYQYLGTSGFVNAASAQPGINWTMIGTGNDPPTGDIYWGLDRFGRVDNCLWQKSGTTLAQIQYGYDRASNRKWRDDGVLTGYDELYSYDGLYRLTDQKRGTLTGTTITAGTFEQQWGLDATGNWKTFKQDNDGNGTWELNQTRTANKVNEITGITNSVGTVWATPSYDGAGNMIGIPNAGATNTGATVAWTPLTEAQWNTLTEAQWNTLTETTGTTPQQLSARYDAWNRLVLITNGTQNVSEHVYDARGYRIRKDTYTSGTLTEARHYYYTPGWQCVEERIGTTTTAERQFVWGLRYIDDLILRDRSTANNGTINERRYTMQDDNWNTVAICDITGFVGERYAYSAYGSPVFMNGTGTVQSSSAIGFETLYAGYRWDGATPQMYYVRNRFLMPMVGTWNKRDPLGYVDGMALYNYVVANPVSFHDMSGLKVFWCTRDLDGMFAGNHHYLVLIPDNPGDFETEVFVDLFSRYGKGTTIAGHNVNGRLGCIRNHFADNSATLEYNCSKCYKDLVNKRMAYKSGWSAECHLIPTPDGMTDTEFIKILLHKADAYETQDPSKLPNFKVTGASNCACWVNTILQESGVERDTCIKCGDFEGIDWGEQNLLDRHLFLTRDDVFAEWIELRRKNPELYRERSGVGSATGGMPGGEPGRGGGLIYQNR